MTMAGSDRSGDIFDYCVVGGGIVGASVALALLEREPGARLLLIEKEGGVARHQTGRNSGVIHSGIYYKPGSLKASLCTQGVTATKDFCTRHGITFRTTGKLIVATRDHEVPRLQKLLDNAAANDVPAELIDAGEISRLEPHITGKAAVRVQTSAIVDYGEMTRVAMAQLEAAGAAIRFGASAERIIDEGAQVTVIAGGSTWRARKVVACAGLASDRLARASGLRPDFRIVPFRGDYYALDAKWQTRVSHLIYPVPDPDLPFLGVHLTPMIDGTITVGPNAVLSLAREGYSKFAVSPRDAYDSLTWPGLWRLMNRHWRAAIDEAHSAISQEVYVDLCRRYAPRLSIADLRPYRAGIRAQAISRDGTMVDDFKFLETENTLHVVNAPSPAATSALPIGKLVARRLLGIEE
jgi:L-2-hydroxyglutarate oxidase